MTSFAELDLVARTQELKSAVGEIRRIGDEGERTEVRVRNSTNNMGASFKSMGGGANSIRQLSLQLSQVAQQGAVTGNYMQALGIQAADMAAVMGVGGAAGVAVLLAGALVPVAMNLMGAGEQAKKLNDVMDDLSGSVGDLADAIKTSKTNLFDLRVEFGENAQAARDMNAAMLQLAQLKAMDAIAEGSKAISEQFTGLTEQVQTFEEATLKAGGALRDDYLAMAQTAARQVEAQFGLTIVQAKSVADAIKQINSGDMQQVASGAHDLAQTLLNARDSSGRLPPNLREAASGAAQMAIEALRANGYIQQAKDLAEAIANTDISAPFAAANDLAAAMVGHLSDALDVMNALNRAQAMGYTAGGGGRGDGMAEYRRRMQDLGDTGVGAGVELADPSSPMGKQIDAVLNPVKSKRGGRGGSSGAGGFKTRLEALQEQLMSERELTDKWYEENKAILEDRRAEELLGTEEQKQALLELENKYHQKLADLQQKASANEIAVRKATVNAAVGLLQQLGQKSEALAKVAVAVNAAQRIMEIRANTAAAIMRAYAELGPIAGSAAAARIATMGAIQQAIAAASATLQIAGGSGGGGGGKISTGSATGSSSREPTVTPTQRERYVRIEVNGEGMFADMLRNSVGEIADALFDESKTGGTTIVVGR